ncbi:MAG TPA: hypothetical protein VFI31_03175 [Pirellulales bacterium]|nr:hypothetical protein [Pirellulales bacterium]
MANASHHAKNGQKLSSRAKNFAPLVASRTRRDSGKKPIIHRGFCVAARRKIAVESDEIELARTAIVMAEAEIFRCLKFCLRLSPALPHVATRAQSPVRVKNNV